MIEPGWLRSDPGGTTTIISISALPARLEPRTARVNDQWATMMVVTRKLQVGMRS
jgi:hypothetical protein